MPNEYVKIQLFITVIYSLFIVLTKVWPSVNVSLMPRDFLTLSMSNNFKLSDEYGNEPSLNDISFSKSTLSFLRVLYNLIKVVIKIAQT